MSEVDLRTIILAYDGSEGAEKAVALARSLAAKYGAHIVVVVCLPPCGAYRQPRPLRRRRP